jgi:hypothetical protein
MTIAAPPESGNSPTLTAWALRQVGSYLGYAGPGANTFGKAAPTRSCHSGDSTLNDMRERQSVQH